MRIILLLHGAPGKSRFLSRPQVLSWPIKVLRDSDLTKSGVGVEKVTAIGRWNSAEAC
jgi:hypothetical protein